jgi:putative ABC transport system substrate-binding protein
MIRRRDFITLLSGAAAAWPLAVQAQQNGVRRIGVLMGRRGDDAEGQKQAAALQRGLEELGWRSNRNIEIDVRWQTDDSTQRQAFAKELVELKPDVLVANTTPALLAAQQATTSVPMVFVAIADPVAQGFVQSLARPGGSITGFGAEEPSMGGKWVEMLREIAPAVRRITVIFNPSSAPFGPMFLPSMQAVGPPPPPEIVVSQVFSDADLESAIAAAAGDPSGGLICLPDSFLNARPATVVSLVARHNLPAIYPIPSFPRIGGLIAYGIERVDIFYRAAAYVDRILRGEHPSQLPVQFPTKFELVLNLKAAKALGLTVPTSMQLLADEVIE